MSNALFGTDGIRALIGQPPLTIEMLPRVGFAIATWAASKAHGDAHILLAHDTRSSCHFVKAALKSGLLLANNTKIFDFLALPTPAACLLTRLNKAFTCGIIITASHNRHEYNGLKIVDSSGTKIGEADEAIIDGLVSSLTLSGVSHDHLGNDYRALNQGEYYLNTLAAHFEKKYLKGKKIVLDCANGATSSLAPHIFRCFGAHVVTLHNKPDGKNINNDCGAMHPCVVRDAVVEHKADAGFAFDGDGDCVIAVNRLGHIKNGDDILAILMDHPAYRHANAIVGTTFSNEGLAAYAHSKGKRLIRADVGDKNVAQTLRLHGLPLGGEPSGHIIVPEYLDSGDGTFAALSLLEAVTTHNNWDMVSFTHHPHLLINIPIKHKKDFARDPLAAIMKRNHEEFPEGRFVVRYSGTESLLLRILVEAPTKECAEALGAKLANQLRTELDEA